MKGSEWAHVHTRATVALEEAEEAVKFLTTVEGDGAAYTARKRLDVFGKEIDRLRLAIADDEASHSEVFDQALDGCTVVEYPTSLFAQEIRQRRDIIAADDEASHSEVFDQALDGCTVVEYPTSLFAQEIRQRRDIIAAFENKQAGLDVQMQNYTGLTGHRAELLGGRIQHEQQGSPSISSMLRAQEQSMKEQDQRIEIMSGAARNTKMIAAEIQREVDEQTHLLDGLESGLTSAGREIRNVNENVSSTPTNPYTLKAFCTLLWALVLLLLVLFWFLGH
eukprot:CAMPEP_0184753728 /NCGR_PEP_ID=MMETSP0315-20130426/44250_1 /TAXON_ID=101924 /ORGANISM="Rhodosorus marinus, Strain UTEX LB 2760" /LENGTH=278 /DNA_ID=CAMNT_0027233113 /DNA_START=227 /DNA_END=1065 /DNA_ORIENTATION=-